MAVLIAMYAGACYFMVLCNQSFKKKKKKDFSDHAVPQAMLDALHALPHPIITTGRDYYSHFTGEETNSQRS